MRCGGLGVNASVRVLSPRRLPADSIAAAGGWGGEAGYEISGHKCQEGGSRAAPEHSTLRHHSQGCGLSLAQHKGSMGVSPVQTQTQFVTFGLLVLLMRAALKTLHSSACVNRSNCVTFSEVSILQSLT